MICYLFAVLFDRCSFVPNPYSPDQFSDQPFSQISYKGTKKNAHLQTFPQKNSTVVHFLVE